MSDRPPTRAPDGWYLYAEATATARSYQNYKRETLYFARAAGLRAAMWTGKRGIHPEVGWAVIFCDGNVAEKLPILAVVPYEDRETWLRLAPEEWITNAKQREFHRDRALVLLGPKNGEADYKALKAACGIVSNHPGLERMWTARAWPRTPETEALFDSDPRNWVKNAAHDCGPPAKRSSEAKLGEVLTALGPADLVWQRNVRPVEILVDWANEDDDRQWPYEYDYYCEYRGARIAVEYQGRQHYELVPWYQDEKAFAAQQWRDERKRRMSEQHQVNLIEIPYQYNLRTPDWAWEAMVRRLLESAGIPARRA